MDRNLDGILLFKNFRDLGNWHRTFKDFDQFFLFIVKGQEGEIPDPEERGQEVMLIPAYDNIVEIVE